LLQYNFKTFMQTKFIILLFFLLNGAIAQNNNKVTFTQNEKVKTLLNKYIEEKRLKPVTDGYRVQLHFGNDRDKAREVKAKFLSAYQNISAYESYQQPNFRVRVGDFRTRLEALKFLKEIKAEFPSSFVVTDEIKFPDLGK